MIMRSLRGIRSSSPHENPTAPAPENSAPPAPALDSTYDARDEAIWRYIMRRFFTSAGGAVGVAVPTGDTSIAITFTRRESDTAYGVSITPSWLTTAAVAPSDKAANGFTVQFGTAAPAGASIDWSTFRGA